MKAEIHPNYKPLKITIGEDVFETHSTLTSGEILMDVDYRLHPAWAGGLKVVSSSTKDVASFNKKFAGLTFGIGKK
ncbi:MAG: 50S ribosomal protein L31 [Janthinobacterium lividum]